MSETPGCSPEPARARPTLTQQDHDKIEELFKAESGPCIRYLALTFRASVEDAWDATQSAFVLLIRHWHEVHAPRAWLRRVAGRIYTNTRRRDQNRHHHHERVARRDRASAAPAPHASALEQAMQTEFVRCLRQLPPAQQKAVALYYDGFDTNEIAEVLDSTPATIRSNLRHGRINLDRLLNAHKASVLPNRPRG